MSPAALRIRSTRRTSSKRTDFSKDSGIRSREEEDNNTLPVTDAKESQVAEGNGVNPISASAVMGECGDYEIHKVSVEPELDGKKRGKLGITLHASEWFDKSLHKAFPKFHSYTYVKSIEKNSAVEKAGVLEKDILCWPAGTEPVVYHNLVSNNIDGVGVNYNQPGDWKLIRQEDFEKIIKNMEKGFHLYVARKREEKQQRSNASGSPISTEYTALTQVVLTKKITSKLNRLNFCSSREKHKILSEAKEDAKNQFQLDRDLILSYLPSQVKKLFGEIGFAKWDHTHLPCLVLSPFKVAPGAIRNKWLSYYESCKKHNNLARMNHFVYWYGGKYNSRGEWYSFIAQDNFVTYKEGMKLGYHKWPKSLEKKVKDKINGKKVVFIGTEVERVHGVEELNNDLRKRPEDRRGGVPHFQEFHELLNVKDLEALAAKGKENESEKELSKAIEHPTLPTNEIALPQKKRGPPDNGEANRKKKRKEGLELAGRSEGTEKSVITELANKCNEASMLASSGFTKEKSASTKVGKKAVNNASKTRIKLRHHVGTTAIPSVSPKEKVLMDCKTAMQTSEQKAISPDSCKQEKAPHKTRVTLRSPISKPAHDAKQEKQENCTDKPKSKSNTAPNPDQNHPKESQVSSCVAAGSAWHGTQPSTSKEKENTKPERLQEYLMKQADLADQAEFGSFVGFVSAEALKHPDNSNRRGIAATTCRVCCKSIQSDSTGDGKIQSRCIRCDPTMNAQNKTQHQSYAEPNLQTEKQDRLKIRSKSLPIEIQESNFANSKRMKPVSPDYLQDTTKTAQESSDVASRIARDITAFSARIVDSVQELQNRALVAEEAVVKKNRAIRSLKEKLEKMEAERLKIAAEFEAERQRIVADYEAKLKQFQSLFG